MDLIDRTKYQKDLLTAYDDVSMKLDVLDSQPTVKAVPIDRLKKFRNEVMNMNSVAIIYRLDKLIEESEE
jgi:hypothetical protein